MAQQYDFGMIGLGVMGSNLLLNMADAGYAVIGFDLKPERCKALEAASNKDTIVKGVNTMTEMVLGLKTPRKIMMLVPAGKPVDDVISSVLPLLEKGDILIDGGNSFFKDTLQRIVYLEDKNIHFFGMGISGGEMGARTGPSMMPGGDKEAYEYLKPILEAIAAKADEMPCVAYMGTGAAGHYVKMVHNGIEYALMQLIAEAYDLLHRGAGLSNTELFNVFDTWNKGRLQSFLIEITAIIFKTGDESSKDKEVYLIDKILDQAGSKGTGKWTSQDAMDLPVPVPTIDMAVSMRDMSVYKEQRIAAAKLYPTHFPATALANEDLIQDLEAALFFSFIVVYAQGLSMLQKASSVHNMNIHLPSVIQVWKSGCIIRSALLAEFDVAFADDAELKNILLHPRIANELKKTHKSARRMASLGLENRVPVAALASAITYFDSYSSQQLPMNLVQAQRDYFGAHTYRRIDKDGVFHTEWHNPE